MTFGRKWVGRKEIIGDGESFLLVGEIG